MRSEPILQCPFQARLRGASGHSLTVGAFLCSIAPTSIPVSSKGLHSSPLSFPSPLSHLQVLYHTFTKCLAGGYRLPLSPASLRSYLKGPPREERGESGWKYERWFSTMHKGGTLAQEAPQRALQHVDLKKSSFRRGQGE